MAAALLEAALGNLLVVAVLAASALTVDRFARRPALSHALWLIVLVKLVTPPVVTVPVRLLPPEPTARPPTAVAELTPAPPGHPVPDIPPAAWARIVAQSGPVEEVGWAPPTVLPDGGRCPPYEESAAAPFPWAEIVVGAWLAGAAVWVGVAVRRVRRFSRMLRFAAAPPAEFAAEVYEVARQIGLHRPPLVRMLPGGLAPLVWAVGRPTLFFPVGLTEFLSPRQRTVLIAHELAHLKRWDHLVRWLEFAVLALYWWCPLAWWARDGLRKAEEDCCDAWVVDAFPDGGPSYASALLDTIDFLSEPAPPALASGLGHDAASVRRRMELILDDPRPSRLRLVTRVGVACLGAVVLLAAPKMARSTATPADPPAQAEPVTVAESPLATAPGDLPLEPVQFDKPTRLGAADGSSVLAVLSPDGQRTALGGADGTVTVRDTASGRVLFTLPGHTAAVAGIAFSPDGRLIATVSHDGTARLWDAETGTLRRTLAGHTNWVVGVAFSPDGRLLATGGYDKTVRLWDVETGELKATWGDHPAGVRAVAFSPDGKLLAAGGADKEVLVRDVPTGAVAARFADHRAGVRCLAFSPDGRLLATGGEGRAARVWDVAAGREVGSPVELPDFVTALRFSPRGQVLLVGTAGGHVANVNPHTGRARGFLPDPPADRPHAAAVTGLAFAPDGSAVSAARDGTAVRWSAAAPPEPAPLSYRGHADLLRAVAVSPDGKIVATGARDGSVRLFDAATGVELRKLAGHEGEVADMQFTPDGTRLVSGGADERVRVWEVASGRLLRAVAFSAPVGSVSVAPDGQTVAVACPRLPVVTLCDVSSGEVVRRLFARSGGVSAVAYAPDGRSLAAGTTDGFLSVWDVATGEERARTPVREAPCRIDGIAFAADGKTAVAVVNDPGAGPDGDDPGRPPAHEVVFWDVADGSVREGRPALVHPGPVGRAVLTPDGSLAVTAGNDGTVRVFDAATARVVLAIHGHAEPVASVAVAPDGTALYSAGDRAARRWPITAPTARADR
jgi:WD40 repeat protein/beta-lactamase regulating signal transducer with metallopeptidase domain